MKIIAPDYYRHFVCIAGACRHSCCIGWEIDGDAESLRRYERLEGAIGEKLRQNIECTPEGACFRLQGQEERCPFLQQDGLCELILTLGEESLCQICTDHPRFRSFYADRTEIGLGLCCEEAGRLILGWKDPVKPELLSDDGFSEEADPEEEALLMKRDQLTTLMQDRSLRVEERVERLLATVGVCAEDFVWRDWLPFLLTLECLDERWAELLHGLSSASCGAACIPAQLQIPMEQLMIYLLYRHLPGAMEDGRLRERLLMTALIWLVVSQLCSSDSLEELTELCRKLSSEWEYSEENILALLDEIEARFPFLQES